MTTLSIYRLSSNYGDAIDGMFRAIAAGRADEAGNYAKTAITTGRKLSKREGGRDEIRRMFKWVRRDK